MSIAVKICGIRTLEALDAAIEGGCSYVGFVHYPPSPRHIAISAAAQLVRALPQSVRPVVVTINPADELIEQIHDSMGHTTLIQLHGSETPARMLQLRERFPGIALIKAIPVGGASDLKTVEPYLMLSDMLLFDAKPPIESTLPGGNGVQFDWGLLKSNYFRDLFIQAPWFLSGGLHAQNVQEAIRQSGAQMVDVSSGVESAPGIKDPALIKTFLRAANASTDR